MNEYRSAEDKDDRLLALAMEAGRALGLRIADIALKAALRTMWGHPEEADAGGLMAYGRMSRRSTGAPRRTSTRS